MDQDHHGCRKGLEAFPLLPHQSASADRRRGKQMPAFCPALSAGVTLQAIEREVWSRTSAKAPESCQKHWGDSGNRELGHQRGQAGNRSPATLSWRCCKGALDRGVKPLSVPKGQVQSWQFPAGALCTQSLCRPPPRNFRAVKAVRPVPLPRIIPRCDPLVSIYTLASSLK